MRDSGHKNKFNPSLFLTGVTVAACHIEKGARKFEDYVKFMVTDLGYSDKLLAVLSLFLQIFSAMYNTCSEILFRGSLL